MKTVSFTENEIDYIKELYVQELERLKQRTNIVSALLDRLEHSRVPALKSEKKKDEGHRKSQHSDVEIENEIKALLEAPQKTVTRKAKGNTARKAKAMRIKPTDMAQKGRPGRKKSENSQRSVWSATVIDTLVNTGRIMPSSAIIEDAMKKQELPKSDLPKIRNLVGGTLVSLKKENKIKTISNPGKRGELYGLAEWFDANGNLDQSKN